MAPQNASVITPGDPIVSTGFAAMQLTGFLLIAIVLATASLTKDIKRSFTWISFLSAGMLCCICYLLLFFAGQQTGPAPDHGLCVAQAALIHATPALQAATNFALILQTWTAIRFAVYQTRILSRPISLILFIMFPYVLFTSLFLGFLMFAVQNPSTILRDNNGVYCKIVFNGIPSKITAGVAAVLMLASLVLEVILGRLLVKNWTLLCKNGVPRSLVIRVMIFGAAGFGVLSLTLVYVVSNGDGTGSDFIMASRE
ncbi:hypothetical protein ONZ45_g4441 [Pleurotus djamor]|nr:hypothetical protein ONZ45_g4441 [Pleurotus djamor]